MAALKESAACIFIQGDIARILLHFFILVLDGSARHSYLSEIPATNVISRNVDKSDST